MSQAPRLRLATEGLASAKASDFAKATPDKPAGDSDPDLPTGQAGSIGIRVAYIAGRDKPLETAVWRIVRAWNQKIPGKKIRVLNQERWRETVAALGVWGVDEILLGLSHYAGQKWQTAHRAWKRYEAWIGVCTQWIEEAMADAERVEAAADRRERATADAAQRVAAEAAQRGKAADAERRLRAMPQTQRAEWLRRAEADLRKAGGFRRVNAATVYQHAIRMLVWDADRQQTVSDQSSAIRDQERAR